MSGRGSRDSGMNTTTISFLAFHSFLNRSILAAASSLMGDPGIWVGPATTQQNRVWESGGAESQTTARRWKEKEGSGLLGARTVLFWLCAFTDRPRPVSGPVCVSVRWVPELSVSVVDLTSTVFDSRAMHLTRSPPSSFSEGLMLCAASGEAAGTFISLDRYAN